MTHPEPRPETREYWFAWQRPGRAVPIHWKGWAAILLLPVAMGILPWLPALWLPEWPARDDPWSFFVLFAAALGLGLLLIRRLLRTRLRPYRRD
jgi:hypothetical protein